MRFYGLLDREHAEVIEFHATREAAEIALAEILDDEPAWVGRFEIVVADFSGADPTVTSPQWSRPRLPPERDRRAGPPS